MPNLEAVLSQLRQEHTRLRREQSGLDRAIAALEGITTNSRRSKNRISPAGRRRIAAAQRARWAKLKGQKVASINRARKRTMSAAARTRIAAAQRARWAKQRKSA